MKINGRFVDTTYMAPELLHYLRTRQLWQEEERYESVDNSQEIISDNEMEDDVIKVETEIPKVIFELDRPECTSNGVCSECELSRKIEEAYRSETSKCSQQ